MKRPRKEWRPGFGKYKEERNIKILEMLSMGLRPKDISKHVYMSTRTVERLIDSMRLEYDALSVSHLVAKAIREKIIN